MKKKHIVFCTLKKNSSKESWSFLTHGIMLNSANWYQNLLCVDVGLLMNISLKCHMLDLWWIQSLSFEDKGNELRWEELNMEYLSQSYKQWDIYSLLGVT